MCKLSYVYPFNCLTNLYNILTLLASNIKVFNVTLMILMILMINYFKAFNKKQPGMINKYELEFNIKKHMYAKQRECNAVSIGCYNMLSDKFSNDFKQQIKLANEKYRNVDNLFCRIRNLLCDEGDSKLVKASRYKRLYNELINDIYEANNILEKHKDELNNLYRIYPIL